MADPSIDKGTVVSECASNGKEMKIFSTRPSNPI